jgi:trehalose 6-phosphate synthase/phosphatase
MNKLIFVSFELPVIIAPDEKNKWHLATKEYGFSSRVETVYQDSSSIWIGSPGITKAQLSRDERNIFTEQMNQQNCYPLFLKRKDSEKFLEGFSNRTIWPLFHYFTQNTIYSEEYWKSYIRVNQEFANSVVDHLRDGDKIWIHDYHLMLLPKLIREQNPNVSIGFFLHITFPSYEIFRLLPWRTEILEGLLGADLIGFHTYDYERHFMSCVRRLLGYETVLNRIHLEERIVKVDFYPLGIDYDKITQFAEDLKRQKESSLVRKGLFDQNLTGKGKKLILSIDRLDYTKGIPLRLRAFEIFLEKYPEYIGMVNLLLFVMPSRESVEHYKILKREVDELVGRINAHCGNISWMPIRYFYRQLPFDELAELCTLCDIGLITPVRDGMNLIAKEFVALKIDKKGVLILSEMAGASKEMSEAIIVNPNNQLEIAEAIKQAIEMNEQEQMERMDLLHKRLQRYNMIKWTTDFIESLDKVKKIQEIKLARKITESLSGEITQKYSKARSRILFLDYDGTLMGFNKDPQKVKPDDELTGILKKLTKDASNHVVIISGRDKETLGKWFPPPWKISFVAEHGAWSKIPDSDWSMMEQIDKNWMETIEPILEFYVDRTPRSFIERKNYSLVWHYRNADPDLGEIRSWELKDELKELVGNFNLEIMDGDKVIEIKNSGINKGRGALHKMGNKNFDFIFAIGDDWTDEYTFGAMPEEAVTVKVGTKTTRADYYVESVDDVRQILAGFVREA